RRHVLHRLERRPRRDRRPRSLRNLPAGRIRRSTRPAQGAVGPALRSADGCPVRANHQTGQENPMESSTRFNYPAKDGVRVVGYRWDPAGEPRGAVQLTHGMGEHMQRYDALARTLTGRGLVVCGQDHRGHGATARSADELGQLGPDGWTQLVEDIDLLVSRIHDEQPGLPLVLLAHSMGSFAVQQYLLDHSDRVDAVVLTGTTALDQLEPALDLDKPIDLAAFNAAFQPARTEFDWLSRDEAIVDAYVADPRCGFGMDTDAA